MNWTSVSLALTLLSNVKSGTVVRPICVLNPNRISGYPTERQRNPWTKNRKDYFSPRSVGRVDLFWVILLYHVISVIDTRLPSLRASVESLPVVGRNRHSIRSRDNHRDRSQGRWERIRHDHFRRSLRDNSHLPCH